MVGPTVEPCFQLGFATAVNGATPHDKAPRIHSPRSHPCGPVVSFNRAARASTRVRLRIARAGSMPWERPFAIAVVWPPPRPGDGDSFSLGSGQWAVGSGQCDCLVPSPRLCGERARVRGSSPSSHPQPSRWSNVRGKHESHKLAASATVSSPAARTPRCVDAAACRSSPSTSGRIRAVRSPSSPALRSSCGRA